MYGEKPVSAYDHSRRKKNMIGKNIEPFTAS